MTEEVSGPQDAGLRARIEKLADALARPAPALRGDYRAGYESGQAEAADRLRAALDEA